jgi:hypothetical protein
MNETPQSAIERAQAMGIDISLLEASLRLTPTERVRKGEAFARFAWSVREQGRLARDKQEGHAGDTVRDAADITAG